MKKAIVTGATSGIGRALALKLAREDYLVGIIGRRNEKLEELSRLAPGQFVTRSFDLRDYDKLERCSMNWRKNWAGST